MADAYWRYDGRQPALPPIIGKRPRSDFDGPGGHELPGIYGREDERALHGMRASDSIGATYDRYLRGAQIDSYGRAEPTRPISGGLGRTLDDPRMMGVGGSDPVLSVKNQALGVGGGRHERPLPTDASSTLFVEGLPANCSRREVAHIFRPFVGYKEVRLVTKESRHSGGDPLVLCFVDFESPAHAATALDALQGYRFDEHDRDSVDLRLQFARYPGARAGGGGRRGRR